MTRSPQESVPPGRARASRYGLVLLLAAVLSVAGAAPGCGDGWAGGQERRAERAVTPMQFVEVVTALREAERGVVLEDSAAALFEERKAQILEREGVTEADLRAFLLAHRDDTTLLEQVWETITERLKHVPPDRERLDRPSPFEDEPLDDELLDGDPLDPEPPPRPGRPDAGEQRLH